LGETLSEPFGIGADVYAVLLRDAARTFYLIRANAALDDPVTGLRHAASHTLEATLPVDGASRDLTGGWYNAGDYGKWTHMTAISASQMMWLYELRPTAAAALTLGIPATYAGLPDLLQQVRWGLDWMLKMQNVDGGVLHKVDSEPLFAWGLPPEADDRSRHAGGPSSVDTAVFVGVMMQAERVYTSLDPLFAAQCHGAADRAWDWLLRHPDVLSHDRYYADDDPQRARLWAAAERAVATHDEGLAAQCALAARRLGAIPFFWPSPQVLGLMSLARSTSASATAARDVILTGARTIAAISAADPYGYAADRRAYSWGSVELALGAAVVCAFAAELTARPDDRRTTQRLLDYVLGCNALGQAFVTGHGWRSVRRPYHWSMRVYGVLMPGWTAGGPNGVGQGADPLLARVIARGTPPAKCYVDTCEDGGSWASNEGEITETAALVLALGLVQPPPG
jgi:endoglucanase